MNAKSLAIEIIERRTRNLAEVIRKRGDIGGYAEVLLPSTQAERYAWLRYGSAYHLHRWNQIQEAA